MNKLLIALIIFTMIFLMTQCVVSPGNSTNSITQEEVTDVANLTKEISILLDKSSGISNQTTPNYPSPSIQNNKNGILKSFMPGATIAQGENRTYFTEPSTTPKILFSSFGVSLSSPKTYPEAAATYVQMDEPGNNAKYFFEYVDGSRWKITETIYHTLSLEIQKEVSIYYVNNIEWTPCDIYLTPWKFESWNSYYLNGLLESRTMSSKNSQIYDYGQPLPDLSTTDLTDMTTGNVSSPSIKVLSADDYCIDVLYNIDTDPPQSPKYFTWIGKEFYSDNGGSVKDNNLVSFTKAFDEFSYSKTSATLSAYSNKTLTYGKLSSGKKVIKSKNITSYVYSANSKSNTTTAIDLDDATKDITTGGVRSLASSTKYIITNNGITTNTTRTITLTETAAGSNNYTGKMTIDANGTIYSFSISFVNNVINISVFNNFATISSVSSNLKITGNTYEITIKANSGNTYTIILNIGNGGQLNKGTVTANGVTGDITASKNGYIDISLNGLYYAGF